MSILVTGGAGFIGSNFVINWLRDNGASDEKVVNLDKLTYAGNKDNLSGLIDDSRHIFICGGIGDSQVVGRILNEYKPRAIINFAAESHVDRSIVDPHAFIQTNIVDSSKFIHAAYLYWLSLDDEGMRRFRFLQVSTDEVYGSLLGEDEPFSEASPYKPNSPYSASKASCDHIARSYFQTYGMPVLTTNCSNNYGAYQYPEKLIPLTINNALNGLTLPIYGDGKQIRDWLYVDDHCSAICAVLKSGAPGEVYNVGGDNERENIEIVELICSIMDEIEPRVDKKTYKEQIQHVIDRLGHDRRYAVNAEKITSEIQWKPKVDFYNGLRKTIEWYLNNQDWVKNISSNSK